MPVDLTKRKALIVEALDGYISLGVIDQMNDHYLVLKVSENEWGRMGKGVKEQHMKHAGESWSEALAETGGRRSSAVVILKNLNGEKICSWTPLGGMVPYYDE